MRLKILVIGFLALAAACRGGQARDNVAADSTATVVNVPAATRDDREVILFVGTSLTAGLGLSEEEAFPALIQDTIDVLELPFRVINAGVNGQTTAAGVRQIEWLIRQPVAVMVLELGANDGLRGLEPELMHDNLQSIIDAARTAHPNVQIVIVGMRAPPNLGGRYTRAFHDVFPSLAAANDAALIPFLLDSVGGIPELNQSDGIHPTAEGHAILARNVWRVLEGEVGGGR